MTADGWVQLGLAAVTTWMAVSTWMLAKASRDANKITRQAVENEIASVKAQLDTVDLMKNAHMPVLDFTVIADRQDTDIPKLLRVRVENKGSGPAFLKEVTVRNDVSISDLYRSPLRAAVIPPEREIGDTLPVNVESGLMQQNDFDIISSWSLWYQDVYRRWYRSRIVFEHGRRHNTEVPPVSRVLVNEFFSGVDPISASHGGIAAYPANFVSKYEFGKVHRSRSLSPKWYSLTRIEKLRGTRLTGTALTNGKPFILRDITFWMWDGYPDFTLEVEGHSPFVVGKYSDDYFIEAKEDFEAQRSPGFVPHPTSPEHAPWADYGLQDTSQAPSQIGGLYEATMKCINDLLPQE